MWKGVVCAACSIVLICVNATIQSCMAWIYSLKTAMSVSFSTETEANMDYITVILSTGNKVTGNINGFILSDAESMKRGLVLESGKVLLNTSHIVMVRDAVPEEIEHYEIHGY